MACEVTFKLWEAQNFLISFAYNLLPGWHELERWSWQETQTGRRNKGHLIKHITKILPLGTASYALKNALKAVMRSWELLRRRNVCCLLVLCPQCLVCCWTEQKLNICDPLPVVGPWGAPSLWEEMCLSPFLSWHGVQVKEMDQTELAFPLLKDMSSLMDSPFTFIAKM